MKYLLLLFFIAVLLASCTYYRCLEIQYDVYSSVLDKKFGKFELGSSYIVGVNNTIKDFKYELVTLIYSVQNNEHFFKEYCQGHSSFKVFILSIKNIEINKEIMDLEKLKIKTKININLDKLINSKSFHHNIYFSKVVFNRR